METKSRPNFWWLKSAPPTPAPSTEKDNNLSVSALNLRQSTSLIDLLGKEENVDSDVDVGSIIEEINRVAAQSPLGPYEKSVGDRSIDDLMKEAEKIYLESSKSFEQLSQHSKTSQSISDLLSKDSTPTPRSLSPLPMDPDHSDEEYTEDFSEESKLEVTPPAEKPMELAHVETNNENKETPRENLSSISKSKSLATLKDSHDFQDKMMKSLSTSHHLDKSLGANSVDHHKDGNLDVQLEQIKAELELKNNLISTLEKNNKSLKTDMEEVKLQLQKTNTLLEQTKATLDAKSISSPEINLELEKTLEQLKDSREINTALQLQVDNANRSQQTLKTSYEDLLNSTKILERRLLEVDHTLIRYKEEIVNLQNVKDKLRESEANLNKLLEIEKLQCKSLKLQNEKDAKCIQDLNRQIKEMERIIARKHPDSVSALIVAAKEEAADSNPTARRILEDRIKALEREQLDREAKSSKVFADIQEKFNQMKSKYENHIEDLETHVSDLKGQLKRKVDTYDVYTQTVLEEKIAKRERFNVFTQTEPVLNRASKTVATKRHSEKEDVHLLATIRGLQTDLANKEKVIVRLQKEVEDARRTNRRLQKEREGSLKNLLDKKEFRSYPEKLSSTQQSRSNSVSSERDFRKEEELQQLRGERDALRRQIVKLEEDYRDLKTKRIQDLTALQEAHERELADHVSSAGALREQLELQRVSISKLRAQLDAAALEMERGRLGPPPVLGGGGDSHDAVSSLLRKIAFLEKRYEEREYRLRTIVQSLAQKSAATDRSCEQCSERQQQLIAYKAELDQLLATVRSLH